MEDDHEEGAYLQVLVKRYEEDNFGQALIEVERKDKVFLYTRKRADHIPYVSENKIPYSYIDWVDRDIFGVKTLGGK